MPRKRRRKSRYAAITINGIKKSLTEWCRETGVDRDLAYQRIHVHGWTEAEAVGKEPRRLENNGRKIPVQQRQKIIIRGRSLKEWSIILDKPYETLLSRWRSGKKPSEILDPTRYDPAMTAEKRKKKKEILEVRRAQRAAANCPGPFQHWSEFGMGSADIGRLILDGVMELDPDNPAFVRYVKGRKKGIHNGGNPDSKQNP